MVSITAGVNVDLDARHEMLLGVKPGESGGRKPSCLFQCFNHRHLLLLLLLHHPHLLLTLPLLSGRRPLPLLLFQEELYLSIQLKLHHPYLLQKAFRLLLLLRPCLWSVIYLAFISATRCSGGGPVRSFLALKMTLTLMA